MDANESLTFLYIFFYLSLSFVYCSESLPSNSTEDPYSALYRTRSITILYNASSNRSLAHQIEEAVVAAFHVGANRYFECIARIALMLKVG
jgi:hypothetical protein